MSGGWFVTGTDTGVGKTRVSCLLLEALTRTGQRAVGMKPVASGCRQTAAGARSEDAESLLAAGNVPADYADINPYALEPSCAPQIAARASGAIIRLDTILDGFRRLQQISPWLVVEGVGGWRVPLDDGLMTADVARAMRLPVILVVGLRLGCLNHALLTASAIRLDGLALAGWIANQVDPAMTHVEENIASLKERIDSPMLAQFPYRPSENTASPAAGFSSETIMHLTQITG